MKRLRLLTAMVGVLMASGGLVLATSDGVSQREGPNHHNPLPRHNPFRQILDELQEIKDLLTSHQGGDTQGLTQNWDKVLPAETRFVVLSDFAGAAVRDNETGLVWEQAPFGIIPWTFARETLCAGRVVGGRLGWRLPSVEELASLVDPSVTAPGPTLPAGHPFTDVQPAIYWSATTSAVYPEKGWSVNFAPASPSTSSVLEMSKTEYHFYWCVRGPGALSVY